MSGNSVDRKVETVFTKDMTENTTPTTTETQIADFGNRQLIRFTCRCGSTCELCLRPEQPRLCLDCRADDDRMVNGWTPENSLS